MAFGGKRSLVLLLGSGLLGQALAQCPSAGQLAASLRTLSAQSDVGAQYPALQAWQGHWERCGHPLDSTYVDGLLQAGLSQFYRNDLPAAARTVQRAVALTQPHRTDVRPDQRTKALYRLGVVYTHQNQSQQALTILNQAVQQGQGMSLATEWVASAHLYLAYLHYAAGDYHRTIADAERGEALALAIGNEFLASKLLLEKARALADLYRYQSARLAAERAVALIRTKASFQGAVAFGYRFLGNIAQAQQRPGEALRYHHQAFAVARAIRHTSVADFAVSLGMCYYRQGHFDQAVPYFQFGIKNSNDSVGKAVALNNLGAVYWKKKQYASAIQHYQRALTTIPIGFADTSATGLPNANLLRRAIQKESVLVLLQDKADTWLDWAKATGKRQYLENALATYATADKMVDYMRWEHTGEGSKKFWREKTHRLYEAALETCHRLKAPERAFHFFEKSRAALLADRLNELGASQLLSPTDRKQETDLQAAVNALRQQRAEAKTDQQRDSLQQKIMAKEEAQSAFIRGLATRNRAYHNLRYDTAAVTLREAREKLLPNGQTLLEYFVGDSAGYALVATATTAQLVRFDAKTYAETARQLLALSADGALNRRFSQFLTLSNRFFREFFESLTVPKGRVIVSPDGAVVPLEMLSRSASVTQPDWLLADYAFTYTYSARVLVKQPQRTSATAKSFLGLAPVAFAGGLPTLGGSDASLHAVADGYFSPTLLVGSAATKRAFLREIPRHRVVQLYAHAQADSSDAEPLIFFADSTLRASDLSTTGLMPTQLVVLSACQTGVGQATRGEGVFSLARALAGAGVPATVTTLWRVDDRATYRLTELFFEKLKAGLPKDEALQRAKLEFLETGKGEKQLPPFWAGLVLIGDAAPLESGVPLWAWVGGGLAALGLGVWALKRSKNKK